MGLAAWCKPDNPRSERYGLTWPVRVHVTRRFGLTESRTLHLPPPNWLVVLDKPLPPSKVVTSTHYSVLVDD